LKLINYKVEPKAKLKKMNSDNLVQLVQKSFRITLGATTSLVEVLQNPEKRQENFSEMRSKLNERMEDWETKGEVTEQEARKFVDTMWQQRQSTGGSPDSPTNPTNPSFRVDLPNFPQSISDLLRFQTRQPEGVANSTSASPTANTSSTIDPQVQTEIQNLTAQIAAMRAELETLRQSGDR
jgi:polyhydroxyalkanoate synthesis regulator phasin